MGAVIAVDQAAPDEGVLARAAETLASGGVVVLPTDSVYGIACAATPGNPAHRRIFEVKRRPADMTLPWFVAEPGDLERYGTAVPAWARSLAERHWPGALTLVVCASGRVGEEYRARTGTIALRVPDSPLCRELVRRVGPLAQTSANTHGQAAATSGLAVERSIVGAVDLTLDAGPAPVGVASTIVDCTRDVPHILRDGAVPASDVLAGLA